MTTFVVGTSRYSIYLLSETKCARMDFSDSTGSNNEFQENLSQRERGRAKARSSASRFSVVCTTFIAASPDVRNVSQQRRMELLAIAVELTELGNLHH
jgi:hypothetical protein